MKKILYTALAALALGGSLNAQNVGIGTATPNASAKLDISSTNTGLLIPRLALTQTTSNAPVGAAVATSLLVYNTATINDVTPGFYYWNGAIWVRLATGTPWTITSNNFNTNGTQAIVTSIPSTITSTNGAWLTTGNTGMNGGNTTTPGTNYIGTNDAQNLDVRTGGIFRARFSALGEFFVGTTNTTLPGDLMNGVSNATFPWAVNGYSAFNGAGVYGQITGGTTIFAAVQGEYNGTAATGSGVRGIYLTTTAGTSFANVTTGVQGQATTAGTYKFGVHGSGGLTTRSGGVMGYDFGIALGALGYYASNTLDYSVYGFGGAYTAGAVAGRNAGAGNTSTNNGQVKIYQDGNTELGLNTNIGLGIYGGVMGGWVRGLKYGFHAKGETYSLYVDGQGFTNKPFTYLMPTATGERVAGYMSAAVNPEVSDKGKVQMENGRAFVAFKENYKKVMSSDLNELVITATPQGSSAGVFITQISNEGFWIYENNGGTSNVQISWMAVSPVNTGKLSTAAELLSSEFDSKMEKVMYNDNNTDGTAQPIWWDGTQMRWDTPPAKQPDPNYINTARPRR